jgi:hypothetical protein
MCGEGHHSGGRFWKPDFVMTRRLMQISVLAGDKKQRKGYRGFLRKKELCRGFILFVASTKSNLS